ncbi:hypothetical protein ACIBBD_04175 [Streptomyces sp. NPDC051315]|uniref:hypothetical protein n=1 Tax=Streptomyces sp. NPDC051315 TaxID=3365650 RepID=UPI0037898207
MHADIRTALAEHTHPSSVTAVLCMGDTLTHLPSKADVAALPGDAARCLAPGGHLVPTFRDLTRPRTGTDRFLPVRATDDRIMTRAPEAVDDDTVMVHDLIHTRAGDTWTFQVSGCPKLRLSPALPHRVLPRPGAAGPPQRGRTARPARHRRGEAVRCQPP